MSLDINKSRELEKEMYSSDFSVIDLEETWLLNGCIIKR